VLNHPTPSVLIKNENLEINFINLNNMKLKLILILFLIIPICSNSQVYFDSINNNELKFKQVYDVDLKKDEIRKLVNKWIAINFKDANTVIKLDNEDNTILKGIFTASALMNDILLEQLVDYTLDVSYKDNKYKVEFYGLKIYSENLKKYKRPVDNNSESFESYHNKRSKSSIEENRINYRNASKYSDSINLKITNYLVDISKTLNLNINKNMKGNDW
jgi:hypothetical protein